MTSSGSGELFASAILCVARAFFLKAAAVSMSKIALFSFRLPFFEGSGFVTGGIVPHCWIWLLGPAARVEAFARLSMILFGVVRPLFARERELMVMRAGMEVEN